MVEGRAEPDDIEILIRLAENEPFGARVIAALLRWIVELQDTADEEELLTMVARLEVLLRTASEETH